ncbi:MAG: glycoside hydrolase family 3 C-terminal domain-containing protein [Gemmiger sp.]|uniref:glycoside hydrolase family 3 C-terminal domain-containing protein n=1 Tax=Gemmiger sp. TaxID=2049027 RepID=UPI002E782B36|nr:glycoside hydrolase family 3 C-terminal domain-containing protein [Gemmiger sp.]MEE0411387.1 glycoside hydrolase family 3 C-terminal domain-containing protein [Gemmiger sp.]
MKHTDIITKLNLEQKCALLSGDTVFTTRGYKNAGVPSITLSDGPNGVRKQAGAADHLGLNPSVPATCFPTAATVACSWDPALGEEIGRAMGEEAAAQEVAVLLGPGLNTKRSPLCGRNFEYFSEDPYLSGKMAAAYVRGIQSEGISACPKHFAVNSQELRRMASDSVVDERTLRELYLTGFEIVVKEAHPKALMSSYNLINGIYANENAHLLQDILREEWGFDGAVVTDWGGSNDHALGVKNGSTLEMPAPGGDAVRELLAAVRSGKITEADVDARLDELLTLVLDTHAAVERHSRSFDADAHHALARRAAGESVVLLKNDDALLPLAEGTRVAVIGDFAETPRYQGAGSSAVNSIKVDTFLDCLSDSGLYSVGFAPGFDRQGKPDAAKQAEAVALAAKADAVLLCLGLDEIKESEGLDRADMKLADNQIELLQAVREANPNTVVIVNAGASLETPWLAHCKALVYGALGGQAGAGAMVDVLTGKINPGGKLAETWANAYADTPARDHFAGPGRTVQYREGLYVGYRYYQTAGVPVAFPFGHGLSYTQFAYSDLHADAHSATLTVTNTGDRAGAEIVQLYAAKPNAEIFRPAQELKAFAKVQLAAGESKTVTLTLDDKAFRYWNTRTDSWEVEGGTYELRVGASSADIRLTAAVEVIGTDALNPYAGKALPHYQSGKVQTVPDAEWETLLGRPIPDDRVKIDRNMTLGELNHGRSPLGWLVWAVMTVLLNASYKKGKPDLNVLFQYNMPLRALAKMTNGAISMGMVDGIVMEVQGFWGIGLVRVIFEAVKNVILNAQLENRLRNS